MTKVLILGGTAEARDLAAALHTLGGISFVSSLAGRTLDPVLPQGDTRIGGFGGVAGLARWVRNACITAVVDATHPFANVISAHARVVCVDNGIPLATLVRPAWEREAGDRWIETSSLPEAAKALAAVGSSRPFLTIGRQGVHHFASSNALFVVRSIDPPEHGVPPHMTLLLDRGPFTTESELALFEHHNVDALVTKNSGGRMTYAKIQAARALSLPVIMVNRPEQQRGADISSFEETDDVLAWIQSGE